MTAGYLLKTLARVTAAPQDFALLFRRLSEGLVRFAQRWLLQFVSMAWSSPQPVPGWPGTCYEIVLRLCLPQQPQNEIVTNPGRTRDSRMQAWKLPSPSDPKRSPAIPSDPKRCQVIPSDPRRPQAIPSDPQAIPGDPRRSHAISSDPQRSQAIPGRAPGDPKRSQAIPSGPRRAQAIPSHPKGSQAIAGDPKRSQAIPGDPKRNQA